MFVVLAALAIVAAEVVYVTLGPNFHTVEAGACYRSAQPSAGWLRRTMECEGIKTVVNLRGNNSGEPWYEAEKQVAADMGAKYVEIGLFSNQPPETTEFRRLVETLDTAPRPLLIHCQRGGDRTGLASAIYVLLQPGRTVAEARGQITVLYGHKFWSQAARMSMVVDVYERWLHEQKCEHSPERFRHWAMHVYCSRDLWQEIYPGIVMP
jgi:protein tyrosine phosphatase (PTP) superfamily phosphohydrolase (DUF442 family)